jgi:hypothetical protein
MEAKFLVPVKNALAPLAGLTMAVIAAGCLVIFSMVASNTADLGAPGNNAARPQNPPGGGDGAVTIALPDGPAGSGGSSVTTSQGGEASTRDEIAALAETPAASDGDVPSGESIAAGAVADFFGGTPDEVIESRIAMLTGIPSPRVSTSRPTESPSKEKPNGPTGDGGPYCPPSKGDKDEHSRGNPHGGPPACGNQHGAPPGYDHEKEESPPSEEQPVAPPRSGGEDSPPPSKHKDSPPPASPPGRSGHAKDGHPHGGPPGQSGNGGKSSGGGGHPHGGPPGQSGGDAPGKSGGHPHGGPPGQAKK